ncbi:DNA-(Apurinic or apyrimidinic site) lyase [Taphrina deformans PYCC 5710]|uniref:DNA-(Apurinic or apyrimidinic site) lyase n=1 Tax=Taphrina deformans (strain PYCC 5710 / ATCC 11124 / CBS 356.35 / IMI 108563 / JCM 9778 / NBRC 8474) TaxID=1097556 RepID=R4XAE7_TAPDE|nr:DNA-(Apurinic or apyrimidinic site) lyase [Taphrina deformans PYCC 5710]|eukprot:CCG82789.1 DNA-(Apurinic or apyrimidinic site) lyase [Taphrina deformans PYCC 5710]
MVKILTWNVAALRPLPPKLVGSSLGTFFKAHAADIDLAVVEGYESFFSFSGKGYAGIATFAKKGSTRWWTDNPFNIDLGSLKEVEKGAPKKLADPDTDPDVSIGRCVLTDHGSFLLLNIYAPNAGRGEEYLARKFTFYRILADCVRKWTEAGRQVIVTGDINTAHSELDIYNPEKYKTGTGFLPEERQWITKLLQDYDMSDAFRAIYPDKRKYSFWDQRRQQRAPNNGWRIDAFYVSNSLLFPNGHNFKADNAGVKDDYADSEILNDVFGSDHCPIYLTLPKVVLTKTYNCKDASSNRPSLNPRRIDGFFSKAARGQGAIKRQATDTDDENESSKKSKAST